MFDTDVPNTKTGDGCLQFLYGAAQLLQPSEVGHGIVALNGGELGDERWAHVAVSFEQRHVRDRGARHAAPDVFE